MFSENLSRVAPHQGICFKDTLLIIEEEESLAPGGAQTHHLSSKMNLQPLCKEACALPLATITAQFDPKYLTNCKVCALPDRSTKD